MLPRFRVCRIAPVAASEPWAYVSIGAWEAAGDGERLEFLILSPTETPRHVETLAMIANYHADLRYRLKAGDVVVIGHAWMEGATCDRLLVSLPYPYGPVLERCCAEGGEIRFLWLLPITQKEHEYLCANGAGALEERFQEAAIDAIDLQRVSVVE